MISFLKNHQYIFQNCCIKMYYHQQLHSWYIHVLSTTYCAQKGAVGILMAGLQGCKAGTLPLSLTSNPCCYGWFGGRVSQSVWECWYGSLIIRISDLSLSNTWDYRVCYRYLASQLPIIAILTAVFILQVFCSFVQYIHKANLLWSRLSSSHLWLRPVILPTQEAKIRRIRGIQPRKIVCEMLTW
jgi:hypothetical protein